MDLDYSICPHCGCRCEDDEFCAACGKLFHEADHVVSEVTILGLLRNALRSFTKSTKTPKKQKLEIEEDLEFDPSWSCLSSNIYNDKR